MDVAILYSGGKDSTYAIEFCKNKNWNIKYLISIKPNRNDCYLYHFATVELTKDLANILGYKQFYLTCNIANAEKEAELVKNIIARNKVDALVLGGIGLQETQLRSLQKALMSLKVEVFASHAGYDHENLIKEMLDKGYKILITQVASEGGKKWLGQYLSKENFEEFKKDSIKYGFHFGGEGGYYDTLVIDGPIFKKKIEIINFEKIFESEYNGYIKINNYKIENKNIQKVIN